jgi:hemerythrin
MAGLSGTRTVTVNAAFFQEIKEVNEELWRLLEMLRRRFERPVAPGHCRHLVELLSELLDQVALHFALEEAYGYFEDPAFVPPSVGEAAERVREEHRALYVRLRDLVERAEEMVYDLRHADLASWLGPQFRKFDAAFRDHESRENELIMDAIESDLGGEQ